MGGPVAHNFNKNVSAKPAGFSAVPNNQTQRKALPKGKLTKRSPDPSSLKRGGAMATSVAYDAWVSSIFPDMLPTSTPSRPPTARKGNKGHTSSQQQTVSQTEPAEHDPDQYTSQSEVVMMQASQFTSGNADSSPRMESSEQLFDIPNPDDTMVQSDFDEEIEEPKTVGTLTKSGGNIAELDRINRQLAEEYKYVEGLRRNLKIAEEALKKQVVHSTQQAGATVTRKNTFGFDANPTVMQKLPTEKAQLAASTGFWSESRTDSIKSRKFQLDPPQEQLADDESLKAQNSRKLLHHHKTSVNTGSEYTPDTAAMTQTVMGNKAIHGLDNFGKAANLIASPMKRGGYTNLNTHFYEEYKQNLQKINAKKASSPTIKTFSSQKYGFSSSAQFQSSTQVPSGNVSAKSISKVSVPTAQLSSSAYTCPQPNFKSKKTSFIGSGLANKIQNNSDAKPTSQKQPTHTFQSSLPSKSQLYDKSFQSFEENESKSGVLEQEALPQEVPYDFDKYELMSTQNQLQQLLNKRQETPKGSSASEEEQPDEAEDVTVELTGNLIEQKSEQQSEASLSNLSPDHSRTKYTSNSLIFKQQRTERKNNQPSASMYRSVASIEPSQTAPKRHEKEGTRTKQLMSPSRNRPNMHQHTGSNNSFLQSYHEMQSPVKTIKGARLDLLPQTATSMTSSKRTKMFMRNNSTQNQGYPQQSQVEAQLITLGGSPAVPPLRQAKHKSTKVGMYTTTTGDGGFGQQNNALTRRTRVNSPQLGHSDPVTHAMTTTKLTNATAREHQRSPFRPRQANQTKNSSSNPHQDAQKQERPVQKLSIKAVLQFLLQEEEWLDQVQDLACSGNFQEMSAQGLLLPRFKLEFQTQTLYASLFDAIDLPKRRPKVFAMQLNIYIVMAALLTELLVLDQPTMRKFASKLDDVLKNCHQNFLIMIDFLLSNPTEEVKKSIDYVLLKKMIGKKLHDKVKANRLTFFRQKNELSRAFLKRIATELKEMNITKAAPAIHDLCSVIQETLRMTIDENGMDISRDVANQKRVVSQLDLIFELTESASEAMKLASMKAHIKKSQQLNNNERKVKSVMRGGKVNTLHSTAQKHVSPPPKRYRNVYPSHTSSQLNNSVQAHLFGAKQQSQQVEKPKPFLTDRQQTETNYLPTVEESENAEMSPTKSTLNAQHLMSLESSEKKDSNPIPTYDDVKNPMNTGQMAPDVLRSKRTLKRQLSNPKTLQRAGSQQVYSSADGIKIVKTTVPSKKSSSPQHQRQNTASSQAQQPQSKVSPLKSQSQLRGIVQKQNEEMKTQFATCSVLPESLAFILANSGTQVPSSKVPPLQASNTFALSVKQTQEKTPEKMPILAKQKSHREFTRNEKINSARQASSKEALFSKPKRRGTLQQKQKTTQSQQQFVMLQPRKRVNTVAAPTLYEQHVLEPRIRLKKSPDPIVKEKPSIGFSAQLQMHKQEQKAKPRQEVSSEEEPQDDDDDDMDSPVIIQRSHSTEKSKSLLFNDSYSPEPNPFTLTAHQQDVKTDQSPLASTPFEIAPTTIPTLKEQTHFKSPRGFQGRADMPSTMYTPQGGISPVSKKSNSEHTSEEEKSIQNITLTEDSTMMVVQPSPSVNVTGAAVGAAVATPRDMQDEPPAGDRNSAAKIPTEAKQTQRDLASESPFNPAQKSADVKKEPCFGIHLSLEKLNERQAQDLPEEESNDRQVDCFSGQKQMQVPAIEVTDEDRTDAFDDSSQAVNIQLESNNLVTPRNNITATSKTVNGRQATASLMEDGNGSGKTGFTQSSALLSPNIEEKPEDDSMKEYVEELLLGGMNGRRSSNRMNSLMFEEDSMMIKREMMRQKQEQYKQNKEQRISLKFSAAAAQKRSTFRRGLSDVGLISGPISARNTVTHLHHAKHNNLTADMFGVASSMVKESYQNNYRSQSLIDLESQEAQSVSPNTARNQDIDNKGTSSKAAIEVRGVVTTGQQLPLESPRLTTQLRIETQQSLPSQQRESLGRFAVDSPILNQLKIQTPKAEEPQQQMNENHNMSTPAMCQLKFYQSDSYESNSAADKGAKSAANAELYAFYQSLIPQNSKEKEQGFNIRSKSMVTSFMDIPDVQPTSQETKEDQEATNVTLSNAYSNQGTFHTPERGPSATMSPNNFMQSVIEETAQEDDETPESLDASIGKNPRHQRKESFKTNAFESIDSFVQLENSLQARNDNKPQLPTKGAVVSKPLLPWQAKRPEEEHEYEGGVPGGGASSNMIDEEQELIDAELALLRQQVSIPYLPPIDPAIISEEEVYTLVLDLDETLIHYECDDVDGDYYLIRPGAIKFLRELALYYEIVIFTAAMPEYADKILDNLDESGFMIKYRLYRQHTTPTEDYAIKDLHLLGRNLKRTIIVDNLAENFMETTPLNGVWVESWYDDMQDQVLPRLQKFLADLVEEQVPDVREYLTQRVKDDIIYACLEANQAIPSLSEIRAQAGIPE